MKAPGVQAKRSYVLAVILCSFFILIACSKSSDNSGNSNNGVGQKRSFYMGFSPWPYDLTNQAYAWTYQQINHYGDIIDDHMEEGVPWPESYSGQALSTDYSNTIQGHINDAGASEKILLSLNPLNNARDGLALYRGTSVAMTLPSPWNTYSLNDIHVKTAYLNYMKRMIDLFHPQYVLMSVEVNELMYKNKAAWPAYVDLHKYIYAQIKTLYPSIMFGVSMTAPDLLDGYSAANHADQMQTISDLHSYIDFLGISLHPFMSKYLAEYIPDDMFDQIYALTDLPIAIAESSYPAQVWSADIGGGVIATFNGSQDKQNSFVTRMLAAAAQHHSPFVVYFCIRDYDALWAAMGKTTALLVWRDTGLYDENGTERSALGTWRSYLQMQKQ